MNIKEMHELFRVLGQQMGMERIRVILPKSIDIYLNDAIINIATQIVTSNVQTQYKEKLSTYDNFVSPINGLSTLNREETKNYSSEIILSNSVMFLYGAAVKFNCNNNFTNCRIIENNRFEQTLDDYCNRATKRYPIISIVSTGDINNLKNNKIVINLASGDAIPKEIKLKYIKMPNIVKFKEDGEGVDCDLPVHLHRNVVELAVQKYFNSVGSTSQTVNNK